AGRDLRRMRAGPQKSRRLQRLRIIGLDLIARDLQTDKPIKRHILIQRPNHKIAIVIRRRPIVILLIPMTLGEPRQIQPMPPPHAALPQAPPISTTASPPPSPPLHSPPRSRDAAIPLDSSNQIPPLSSPPHDTSHNSQPESPSPLQTPSPPVPPRTAAATEC